MAALAISRVVSQSHRKCSSVYFPCLLLPQLLPDRPSPLSRRIELFGKKRRSGHVTGLNTFHFPQFFDESGCAKASDRAANLPNYTAVPKVSRRGSQRRRE